jgi:hypothetical protein
MSRISFSEGVQVHYKQMFGIVRFVCDQYITVCVKTFPNERVRDVCLIVYPQQYHTISLVKESEK